MGMVPSIEKPNHESTPVKYENNFISQGKRNKENTKKGKWKIEPSNTGL
jgi:hypothetical protein